MSQCGYSLCRETLEHYPEAVVDLFVDEREKNKAYSSAKTVDAVQATEGGRVAITEICDNPRASGTQSGDPLARCLDGPKEVIVGKKRALEQKIDTYTEEIEQLEYESHAKLEALQRRYEFEKTEIEHETSKRIRFKKAKVAKLDEICSEIFIY